MAAIAAEPQSEGHHVTLTANVPSVIYQVNLVFLKSRGKMHNYDEVVHVHFH